MNKEQLTALFVCSLCFWTLGNGLLPLLPVYASQLGATPALVGYYLSISYVALALGTLAAGWLSDRFQRRKVLFITASALNISAMWLMGQAANAWQLTILTSIAWFLGGVELTLIGVLAGLSAGQNERGRVFGILALTSPLGALIGGMAVGRIADRWGYPTLFTTLAGLSALTALSGLFLEDKVRLQPHAAAAQGPTAALGRSFYFVLLASLCVSLAGFISLLAMLLDMHQLHFSSADVTGTTAIGGLIALPFSPFLAWLSDRFNRKILLALGYLVGALGLATLSISVTLGHFWLAFSLTQIQNLASQGVGPALITDLVPKEALGKGLSFLNSASWIGGIIGFSLAGVAIEAFGLKPAFLGSAVLVLVAIGVLALARYERSSGRASLMQI